MLKWKDPEFEETSRLKKRLIPLLSFIPESNRVKYPHIKPGIYIFVQDKESKEIYLWNSNAGHGHPFLASLVNRNLNRQEDDFSWIGAAGEIVFGDEILGLSFCTGFFHKTLKLTEADEDYVAEPTYIV